MSTTPSRSSRAPITLEDFEFRPHPKVLTSPRSILACKMLGIIPEDLIPRDRSFFEKSGVSSEVVELRLEHYQKRRISKLESVRMQRLKIIEAEAAEQQKQQQSEENENSGSKHADPMSQHFSAGRYNSPARSMSDSGSMGAPASRREIIKMRANEHADRWRKHETEESFKKEIKLETMVEELKRAEESHLQRLESVQYLRAQHNKDVARKQLTALSIHQQMAEIEKMKWDAKEAKRQEQMMKLQKERALRTEITHTTHFNKECKVRVNKNVVDMTQSNLAVEKLMIGDTKQQEINQKLNHQLEEVIRKKKQEAAHRAEVMARANERRAQEEARRQHFQATQEEVAKQNSQKAKDHLRMHIQSIALEKQQRIAQARARQVETTEVMREVAAEKVNLKLGRSEELLEHIAREKALLAERKKLAFEDKMEAVEELKRKRMFETEIKIKKLET